MNRAKVAIVVTLLLGARVLPAGACVTVAEMEAAQKAVPIVDESAVIVWDEKTRTEHFIRSAAFAARGHSVGFIVPTPSVPQLTEANDDVFRQLEEVMKPKVVHQPRKVLRLVSVFTYREQHVFNAAGNMMTDDDDSVSVLSTRHIAGYDATILKARRADALQSWLKKNHYATRPGLENWLAPYIAEGWVLTAFKIRKPDKNEEFFSSSLVRMSFHTPRPFFPYREVQDKETNANRRPRSLRIFFFAPTRMKATPGNFAGQRNWPGQVKWADEPARNHRFQEPGSRSWLKEDLKLPATLLQRSRWLTVFQDFSAPRPGTDDVFFENDASTQRVLPPPVIVPRNVTVPIYVELVILATALAVFGGLWLKDRFRPGI